MNWTLALVSLLTCTVSVAAHAADPGRPVESIDPIPVFGGPNVVLRSSSSVLARGGLARAASDTFALYGGPAQATEGKFQLVDRTTPDWGGGNGLPRGYGGGPAAWMPVDLTYHSKHWHPDTFNAENLNGNGPGNVAMWCGVAADDPEASGWVSPPGYGNGWNDELIYESAPLDDRSIGQTVGLDFYFNHDLEPGFDFFLVEFDSAGVWVQVYATDASNVDTSGVFLAPGVNFASVQQRPISYAGFDYGGAYEDQIRIRLVVDTDGGWSDEDGYWPTIAGAVQLDDVTLTTSQGTFFEDFEGAAPYLFEPGKSPFAGDFADVYPQFDDPDPCRYADTPVVGFIDYGQVVRNGPGVTGLTSTGGTTSPGIDYGIPGNYVVNYNGGLSLGTESVLNEIWSPDILWDVEGGEDDDPAVAGSFLRFSVWNHLPVTNGIFFVWHVRSALPGEDYTGWRDRSFVYHGQDTGYWSNQVFDTSDLIQAGAERVQLALGAWDYASVFGFPGTRATPSPVFDNVAFSKYRVGGPALATRNIELAQDGFPVNGSIDASSPATRAALDVPFDMALDVSSGDLVNTPGDSVTFEAASIIPGATIADLRMVWALKTNSLFEDALRAAPARVKDENVVAGAAGTVWTGEVVARQCTVADGVPVANRFFVDLPDVDFLYPGDVLHYYLQATDSGGRTSTLPADVTGFGDFAPDTTYDRTFTVRALPGLVDEQGEQPPLLVINDFGRRGNEAEFTSAFAALGMLEGEDFDTYTVQGPSSTVSNGIGSAGAHGATAQQLAGYEHVFYLAGNLSAGLLSNGNPNDRINDKGNDVGVLEQWHALPGARNAAYFGDFIAAGLAQDSYESFLYLTNTMRVEFIDRDVRDVIAGQVAPVVVPAVEQSNWFASSFVVFGGCPAIAEFDQIQPLSGAVPGHYFTGPDGAAITDPAAGVASVVFPTGGGVEVTFPFSTMAVRGVLAREAGPSALARLFEETLQMFGYPFPMCGAVPCTDAPEAGRGAELAAWPNPFNPSTTVEFTAATGAHGSVRIYNLRGEVVKTLHRGEFFTQRFTWDGTDDRGASVASGVYVVRAEDGRTSQSMKVALVK